MSEPTQTPQPPNIITRLDVPTPSGLVSVTTSLPTNPPSTPTPLPTILFIHGNSSSSRIFESFFFPPATQSTQPLCATHPLLTFDLPGHGASTNAPPSHAPNGLSSHYTMPSYALTTLSLLNSLSITKVITLGWSLGGHVAIELLPLLNPPPLPKSSHRLLGLVLTGTPPVPRGNPSVGFHLLPDGTLGSAERAVLTDAEQVDFATFASGAAFGGSNPGWILEDVKRTDGRARSEMAASFRAGEGVDQKAVVEETQTPIAVINGMEDVVKWDYLDEGIKWGNLWRGKTVRFEGLGHTPFWEDFGRYEAVFREFVADCEGGE